MPRTHNIEEVKDHSVGLLVTGVTRIVEKIYVITCIRPGWYKLFPQLVISFSLTSDMQSRLILQTYVRWGQICAPTTQTSENFISHTFNVSPLNLVSFPILRRSYQQCQNIFANSVVLNKTWKTVEESTGSIEWLFILVLLSWSTGWIGLS